MKINKSDVMKRAWEIRKGWNSSALTFGDCLKRAWEESKIKAENAKEENRCMSVKFENNMEITIDGYTRELVRWTKGGHDRVYINGGSRNGEGFVDIKNKVVCLRNKNTYAVKMAEIILKMEF